MSPEAWFGPGGIVAGVGGVLIAFAGWFRAVREIRNADARVELQRAHDEEKLQLEREKLRLEADKIGLEERTADVAGLQALTGELRSDLSRLREDLTDTRRDLDEERRRTDEATAKIEAQGKELARLADERTEAWTLVRRLASHLRAREDWTMVHLQPRPPSLEEIPEDIIHIVFPERGPFPREPPDTS